MTASQKHGRVLAETRGSATTTLSWDANGNLASVTPPGKPTHSMTYTPVNLLSSYNPPVAGLPASATGYAWNVDRTIDTETRPGGTAIGTTYDVAGRLDTITVPGGLVDHDYFSAAPPVGGAAGRISSISGPYGVNLAYTYDGPLTTSSSWTGAVTGSVAWLFDNDFDRTLETVTGNNGTSSVFFGHDLDKLITCASPTNCTPPASDALGIVRHPQNGLVTSITLGSISEAFGYNAFGELASQAATISGSPVASLIYDEPTAERDALGRITRKTETIQGVTTVYGYTYDAHHRLSDVSIDGVPAEHYGYDANGNRLSATTSAGTVTATYDDQDRLLEYGDWEFTYTANGELETKTDTATEDTWLFQYDVLGNLLAVSLPDGTLIEYLVDGLGRRVGKKVNSVLVKQWLYRDELKPVAELDGSGNLVAQFVYATGRTSPELMLRGGVRYRIISDQLGSPRLVVNADTGAVVQRMRHDAWGNVLEDTNPGLVPFGFAGGLYDPDTGLTRFGARDFDPVVGRWTRKDPILFEGGDANLYGYIVNDPVNLLDPPGTGPVELLKCLLAGISADTCWWLEEGSICNGPLGDLLCGVPGPTEPMVCGDTSAAPEPSKKDRCYQVYLEQTAYCGSMWTDDRYDICMKNAWINYIRCLNGQPPKPLVPVPAR